jgi:antitoxin HicB
MPAEEYQFTAVFEPAEEGGYIVTFPAIPGLVTEGDTLDEARSMASDALRCFIEGCKADSQPIPVERRDGRGPLLERISVALDPA